MKEQVDFTERVVVVTGAASGIGEGIAKEFAKEGANIVIADIDTEGGQETADEIESEYGVTALVERTDISDYDACQETVEATVDEFGRLDTLVNCAAGETGDLSEMSKPFLEERPSDWDSQFDITLRGTINMTHNALAPMVDQESGSVISLISDSYQGQDPDLTVYASAKAALVTFTTSLAKEVGEHGVRVNAISPSTTKTPATEEWLEQYGDKVVQQYPLGRVGRPEDHANAAVFLASDAASWITGQTVSVNGGFL